MSDSSDEIREKCYSIIYQWLESCTRSAKISRNTIAIGIVVMNHLRKSYPITREQVVSSGGEIKGARSGLSNTLRTYGIPVSFLKEVTTRQSHQDGQRLLEQFDWGGILNTLSPDIKDMILVGCIDILVTHANAWFLRQQVKPQINRRHSPATWVNTIVESAKGKSGGVVEQHLIGAKLERRFPTLSIDNNPAHAGDQQTARLGDFAIAKLVYHVTANPSRDVIGKCKLNLAAGYYPVLLVPASETGRARILAQEEHIESETTITSIEDFIALNIMEIAISESKDFYIVLQEIIQIYNKRLTQVETDLSLQIEIS